MANDEYRIETSDLYFSAFLLTKGCTILMTNVDKETRNKKVTFVFNTETAELSAKILTDTYFNATDESCVPALLYQEKIRALKTRCHIR